MSGRSGSWVSVALVASLCLNLFLVGIAAAWIVFKQPDERKWRRGPIDLRTAIEQVEPESRDKVMTLWRSRSPEMRARARGFREARGKINNLLVDPQASAADRERAFLDMREATASFQVELHGLMEAIAAILPPEERARFFEAGLKRREKRRSGRRDRFPDDTPREERREERREE